VDGVFHYRLTIEHAGGTLKEHDFGDAQFFAWCGSGENAFAQFAGEAAPDIVKADVLVVKFVGGKLEEGNCSGGTERDSDDAGLLVGIDSETAGMRAADAATGKLGDLGGIVRIVESGLVFHKIDDQADATIGHQAFFAMELRSVFVIPKQFHEAGEWRSGGYVEVRHGF